MDNKENVSPTHTHTYACLGGKAPGSVRKRSRLSVSPKHPFERSTGPRQCCRAKPLKTAPVLKVRRLPSLPGIGAVPRSATVLELGSWLKTHVQSSRKTSVNISTWNITPRHKTRRSGRQRSCERVFVFSKKKQEQEQRKTPREAEEEERKKKRRKEGRTTESHRTHTKRKIQGKRGDLKRSPPKKSRSRGEILSREPECPDRGSWATRRAAAAGGGGGEGEGGRRSFTAASPVWSLRRDMHRPCPRPALVWAAPPSWLPLPSERAALPPPRALLLWDFLLSAFWREGSEGTEKEADEEKELLRQSFRGGSRRPFGLAYLELLLLLREAGVEASGSLWEGCSVLLRLTDREKPGRNPQTQNRLRGKGREDRGEFAIPTYSLLEGVLGKERMRSGKWEKGRLPALGASFAERARKQLFRSSGGGSRRSLLRASPSGSGAKRGPSPWNVNFAKEGGGGGIKIKRGGGRRGRGNPADAYIRGRARKAGRWGKRKKAFRGLPGRQLLPALRNRRGGSEKKRGSASLPSPPSK
ncbi:hypothetical protein E2320_017438 [Naja naja]|nr:hypothetical protein E2320_017438 [Naja naja]